MGENIVLATSDNIDAEELVRFYERVDHPIVGDPARISRMVDQTFCFVTARLDGELVGIARGVTDGLNGYLAECKLDPSLQGPACVTKTDGRIEHDLAGVAKAMATRVVEELRSDGADRIQVLAYGTEVDFCEELGFRRATGMVVLQLPTDAQAAGSDQSQVSSSIL
ncbi:MAG TPA: hypothetical protein PKN33_14545 [Phycisphaerae bacterium]|nr:GNAT family N-acetyltransferase [Phycisphaerales bacterium]HNO79265.1 hypothetical protein [Phycisphaerae bacterium]